MDRFGVWLSKRQINRVVGTLVGKDVADIGCGYEADFMRRVLGEVRSATLVDVSLAPDLAEHPKVRAIEGLLPGAMDQIEDDSLDVVLCMSVVEHLWEPEQTARALPPGAAPRRGLRRQRALVARQARPGVLRLQARHSRRPRRWTTTRCTTTRRTSGR